VETRKLAGGFILPLSVNSNVGQDILAPLLMIAEGIPHLKTILSISSQKSL